MKSWLVCILAWSQLYYGSKCFAKIFKPRMVDVDGIKWASTDYEDVVRNLGTATISSVVLQVRKIRKMLLIMSPINGLKNAIIKLRNWIKRASRSTSSMLNRSNIMGMSVNFSFSNSTSFRQLLSWVEKFPVFDSSHSGIMRRRNGTHIQSNNLKLTSNLHLQTAENRRAMILYPPVDTSKVTKWSGSLITSLERDCITKLRHRITSLTSNTTQSTSYSHWITTCSDIDILRFLRSRSGHIDEAWKSILRHAEWRIGSDGADTVISDNPFANSPLHKEIFWFGIDKNACPTLVIRTQAHDGVYYNEDPKVFTRFIVWMLEEGRRRYQVGSLAQVCVLIDRAPIPSLPPKDEKFDVTVIGRLVDLFRVLHNTLQEQYPDLLSQVKVLPASWFFRMCCGITLRILDGTTRDKIHLVQGHDIAKSMLALFPVSVLPVHLGGLVVENRDNFGGLGYGQ